MIPVPVSQNAVPQEDRADIRATQSPKQGDIGDVPVRCGQGLQNRFIGGALRVSAGARKPRYWRGATGIEDASIFPRVECRAGRHIIDYYEVPVWKGFD